MKNVNVKTSPWVAFLCRMMKYYFLILLLFALEKLFFLFFYRSFLTQNNFTEVLSTFYHAFHLDFSAACYICAIPFMLLTLQLAFSSQWMNKVLNVYTLLALCVIVITAFGNIFLYDEWGMKLNYRIWYYLQKPDEVIRTATWQQLLLGLGGGALVIGGCFWGYLKWIAQPVVEKIPKFYGQTFLIILLGFPLIFIGMRGRVAGIPITQSNAYFSTNQVLNDAATNTQWNLLKSTISFYRSNEKNIFATMDKEEAQKIVEELFVPADGYDEVLNTATPNIVIIFLESWSADLIASLGGKEGIAPCFAELEKDGLLFTQVYAAGHRSQEGISAMISGNPPIPLNVITDSFDKYRNLSSLAEMFNRRKYQTSFYFGGDLDYGNLKAYLMSMKFGTVIDEADFPALTPHGSLSIYDEIVLNRHREDLKKMRQPFFSALFTASTHSPYDVPTPPVPLEWDMPEMPYVNSAHYTDYCLGEYFEKVKREPWYANTLFILVADHSHPSYKEWYYYDAGYQHVPMLWLGGALKKEWRGKQIDRYCSYIDLPCTLMAQLGMKTGSFHWSRNILGKGGAQFAPVSVNVGIEWITPDGSFALDITNNRVYADTYQNDSLREVDMKRARAYLQSTYQDYLEK